MTRETTEQQRQETAAQAGETPFWEKVVAAIGLLMVVGSLGYLVWEGIWGDHSPPDIVVEQERVLSSGKDYLVQFKARNEGGETAAEVRIVGKLSRSGEPVEEAETTIDYVPSGSEQRGGLYFSSDPRIGELELSASGYRAP